jgi:hypothetical protein
MVNPWFSEVALTTFKVITSPKLKISRSLFLANVGELVKIL